MTAAGTPRTELPDQVIVRKPEQARRRRLHAGQLLAMTGATRRHVERGIAVIHQRATALKNVGRRPRLLWWRIRDMARGKVVGHFLQIPLATAPAHVRPPPVMTGAIPE